MPADPYMRARMKEGDSDVPPFQTGEPLEDGWIGKAVESRNDRYPKGNQVHGNLGWRSYW